jgi:ATP-dependent RNA helicase DDX10/DBP4
MFERKNHKQELYRKIVEQSVIVHEGPGESDSEDDFMTVKRTNHELPSHLLTSPDRAADISKRQLKIGKSKKAMAKTRALGEKLIFDEEGNAHQVYEMKPSDELARQGIDVVKLGQEFAEGQRGAMKEIDAVDEAVAKEKRKERKRKHRDKEKVCYQPGPRRYLHSLPVLRMLKWALLRSLGLLPVETTATSPPSLICQVLHLAMNNPAQ